MREVEGAMVLIQLLLPTSGAAKADGLAPLAETQRELAARFNGLTAYLRSPAKDCQLLSIAIVILLLRYMQPVLLPVVLGALLFYALDPAVDRLQT